jgi:hypothetical protein
LISSPTIFVAAIGATMAAGQLNSAFTGSPDAPPVTQVTTLRRGNRFGDRHGISLQQLDRPFPRPQRVPAVIVDAN